MNTAIPAEPKLRDKPLSPAMLRELSARSDVRGVIAPSVTTAQLPSSGP